MGIPILVRHLNMDTGPRFYIHKAHKPCVDIMATTNLGRLNCHKPLQWRHNERDGISNHLRLDCLFNFCLGADQRKHQSSASLVTGDRCIPSQRVSNAENVYIWWRHLDTTYCQRWFESDGYMNVISTVISMCIMPQKANYEYWFLSTYSSIFYHDTLGNPFAHPGKNITHPFCYLLGKCSFCLINQYLCTGEHLQSDLNIFQFDFMFVKQHDVSASAALP